MSSEPKIPPPPEDPDELLAWAGVHGVLDRLDEVVVGRGGGELLPGRENRSFTYRDILLGDDAGPRHSYFNHDLLARRFLHRIASLVAAERQQQAWMAEHGQDPEDEVLRRFLEVLRAAEQALGPGAPRKPGTRGPGQVHLARAPVPLLVFEESALERGGYGLVSGRQVALLLLGWNDGPLTWQWGVERAGAQEVPEDLQRQALGAMIDHLRDPRAIESQELLAEVLRLPAWRFALGNLDEHLSELERDAPAGPPETRIAYRVVVGQDGEISVEATVQKRGKRGYSKGSRIEWYRLAERQDLSPADKRVFQAYDDRFARRSDGWSTGLSYAQTFGILRALVDHPAVTLAGAHYDGRPDIRVGRLRLRFGASPDGGLTPEFELLGHTLLAPQVGRALRDQRHLIHLHRPPHATPQLLLAQLSPQATAVVRALALAPARFPPEAHDALATRLESLQESMDIEFPSHWTRTIGPADGRTTARLELLASGALQVRLCVRPVKLGPVFPPGEGPALVLEGQGRERHGARRDRSAERQTAHALAERLGLGGGQELEPWCWRIGEGDPALDVVSALEDLRGEVMVEWADDQLQALGSIGRGDMRMKVADKRDWFEVEGGAKVHGEVVPLVTLLAAIRDGRRYVAVGARGFARIENQLREALARAEGALFELRGSVQMPAVATDSLLGLVEAEAQIEASTAWEALRRRMREGAVAEPVLPPLLEAALRPYQKAGVTWLARLAHWGAGAVLADEMGLGKTVQTLALLVHRAATGPALVVAPTSVVPNWIAEAARFAPELRVHLYRGAARAGRLGALGPGDLLVTSYTLAAMDAEALQKTKFGTLVLDEAQAVKNAGTERAKALRGIDAGWRLGLTGTPIENHLGELWSLFRVVSPGLLGSWEQFRGRYAVPIEKFGDEGRRRALAVLLRPFVLRRVKSEVAPELPARTEVVRAVELSPEEMALYQQLRESTLAEMAEAKKQPERDAQNLRFVLLAALTRLRQLCCHPRLVYPDTRAGSAKAAHLLELLSELREGGHKVLVFSQFRSFLELLAPRLREHGFSVLVLDGTTPAETREQRIAAFQRGEADAFLISLKAGGFGLNLTAADTVIHLDPWWNPAVEDQATARAHRIGQDRPVTAVRLVARDTIEEAVLTLHAAKRALAAGVLEGTDTAATLNTDELVDLIRSGGSPTA